MIKVESSNINAIDFEDGLIVEYKSGVKYRYKGTTKELFDEMLKAESKGHFMNENVKGKFEYERV